MLAISEDPCRPPKPIRVTVRAPDGVFCVPRGEIKRTYFVHYWDEYKGVYTLYRIVNEDTLPKYLEDTLRQYYICNGLSCPMPEGGNQ